MVTGKALHKNVFSERAAAFVLTAFVLAVATYGAEAKSCRLVFSGYEGKETLVDFPALVKIPDGLTGFDYSDSAADGSDLAFFGVDGTRLAHEIDTWDPDGTSYVWVRVPELTKATAITAKWGVSRATVGTPSLRNVWDDDYLAVWHFSKFRKGVTLDSKNGLVAELRGKDTEVAEGGVLGNATTTISEGAALTFKAGSGLSSAITVGGPVTIEGNMTFSGTPSITVPEGGSLVIAEGAKITVADDVQESTLITGLALTATQLEELFDTPYGAVKLNANGDVVYFNAFMWESALAGEDLYFKYGITATANVLIGAACEETDVVRYVESANATRAVSGETPNSVLTDGDVHLVGRYNVTDSHYEKMYAITSDNYAHIMK